MNAALHTIPPKSPHGDERLEAKFSLFQQCATFVAGFGSLTRSVYCFTVIFTQQPVLFIRSADAQRQKRMMADKERKRKERVTEQEAVQE